MKQRFSKRTRLVSALLTLAMVFTFLPISAFAATDSYGPVYISNLIFPDETFLNYVKRFDKDHNGTLWPAERYAVTEIDVHAESITSLKGIEFFPNLKRLVCYNNQLTGLDVHENTALEDLFCSQNQLTGLDVRQNAALQSLYCYNNQLTSLDVSQNTALEKLDCDDNNLTSLDVSKNTELTYLNCSYNQLTELDVSKNTALEKLYYDYNQLTSLKADNCTNLQTISYLYNEYSVQVYESTRVLDPSTLPGNFDISRVRKLTNATKNADGTLTVKAGVGKVTYEYRVLKDKYAPFTLNVEVVPEGSIAIIASNFPDPNFRAYVKAKFDKDNNNCLSESERNAVKEIDVDNKGITTLEGISYFPNLFYLNCKKNQLTELDVSKNPALWGLECDENQLSSLDVSQNAKLVYLYCNSNNLTSLDVSQTAVTTLYASDNKIDINVEETPRTFNLSTLPGFDASKVTNWNGGDVDGNTLKVKPGVTQVTYTYDCGNGRNATFTLNVKVVPDGTVTPPSGGDTPGGTTPGGSTGGGDGGGAVVIVAAAGAVAAGVVGYGVYNYVSGRKLQALLPEGVAAPENRAQTALLLWNTAGRPEPAEAPAFADVADPDTAKAAQWCVEQGLMKRRLNGKFAPGSSIPAYQVLNAYRKLAG